MRDIYVVYAVSEMGEDVMLISAFTSKLEAGLFAAEKTKEEKALAMGGEYGVYKLQLKEEGDDV